MGSRCFLTVCLGADFQFYKMKHMEMDEGDSHMTL